MNSISLDPRSLSIADFTVGEVHSGPGVNNFLSFPVKRIPGRLYIHVLSQM